MKKPLAIFTIVRNEAIWLPRWLAYYGKTGGDLHILDHESDNPPVSAPENVRVRRVTNPVSEDVPWMLRTVEETLRELLEYYQTVVFAEADEFLVAGPHYPNLRAYIDANPGGNLTAAGFNICELPGSPLLAETPDPVLGRGWKRDRAFYDKTLICRTPMRWEVGFHRPAGCSPENHPQPDAGLYLLHFHYADRGAAWARLQTRMAGRPVAAGGFGFQNKFTDRAAFDAWFDAEIAGATDCPGWLLGMVS